MLSDGTQPVTYFLFDHSYAGGSWNGAVLEQAAALRKRAEAAEARALASETQVKQLEAKAAVVDAEQEAFILLFRQRQQALEGQVLKIAAGALQTVENNNRLRSVVDAFYEYRKHVYFCNDCGDGDPCEEGDILYCAALTAVDSVCGKPEQREAVPEKSE